MSEKFNKNEDTNNSLRLSIAQKSVDMLYFKEEILKEVSQFEKNFEKQNKEMKDKLDNKIKLYDSTIDKIKSQFEELSQIVATNTYLKGQIDKYEQFKQDIIDLSGTNQIKYNLLEKETKDNLFKINNIINNSVLYPRVIGNNSKFKNFHEYIDYTLTELTITNNFRTRFDLDFKSFKAKIDKIMQSLKLKIECAINSANLLVQNGLQESELKIKEFIQGKIFDLQVKNNELELKIEKALKELNTGIYNMNNKTTDLSNKLNDEISKFNTDKKVLYKSIEECNNNNKEINNNIQNLENQIKLQEENKFNIENNKKEIIEIIKDAIKEEKMEQNLNFGDKNINVESFEASSYESKKKKKNVDTNPIEKNTSNEKENEVRNNKYNSFDNKKLIEKATDKNGLSFLKKKNNLINLNKKYKYKNNSYVKDSSFNINNMNNIQKSHTNKEFFTNTNYNNFHKIKDSETNNEEANNNSILLVKESIKGEKDEQKTLPKKVLKLYTNSKIKCLSSGKKLSEIRDPLKTILKLKLDLKDINAQFYSDINLDDLNEKGKKNNRNLSREKTPEKNYPFTGRKFSDANIENQIDAIKYQNTVGIGDRKIKDALKLKSSTPKLMNYNQKNESERNNENKIFGKDLYCHNNIYKENSNSYKRINNNFKLISPQSRLYDNQKKFILPEKIKTFLANNKNLNKTEVTKLLQK